MNLSPKATSGGAQEIIKCKKVELKEGHISKDAF